MLNKNADAKITKSIFIYTEMKNLKENVSC